MLAPFLLGLFLFQIQSPAAPVDTALTDSAQAVLADTAALADTTVVDSTDFMGPITDAFDRPGDLLNPIWYQEVSQALYGWVLGFLPNLFRAIFLLLFYYAIYRSFQAVLQRVFSRARRIAEGLKQLLFRILKLTLFALATVSALKVLGLNVDALLAGLGIAGIAIGFAAKDSLENMISGITILFDTPFEIGDNLRVDDIFGTVVDITLRSTRIRTVNNEIAVIPNSSMINHTLINHTKMDTLRIAIPFGIAYKEFPQQAREVVLALTKDDPRLQPGRQAEVVVIAMNSSSVDMELRLWLRQPKQEVPIRWEYMEKVREALREADIEIPFPHLQLFIDEAKAFEGTRLLHPPGSGSS